MSTEAVKWAMDDAPLLRTATGKPDTTARHVLQTLAEYARKDGTGARPSLLRLQYRTGYDRRTVQRAMRRLEDAGLITADGTVHGCTRWNLAIHLVRPVQDWAELGAEEEAFRRAATERKRRSRAQGVTHSTSVTVTHSDDVTEGGVTHSASVRHALEMRDVTHSASGCHALSAALTTKEPPREPPRTKDSSASADAEPATAPPPPDLTAFGAFWLVYPKKRDRQEALKAWQTAVESGVDPQKITDAAAAYARERADQDPKYTKHPANWLNKGCYDDEPDPPASRPQLRAVSGGYQGPFQCPPASTYENNLGF